MITVLEVIKKTADFLSSKGVESSRLNAEVLVGHALGLSRMKLYLQFERILTESELEVIRPMVRRRGQREPLQYIIGHVEFSGITLKVDKRALIPRPETEYLIDLIKEKYKIFAPKQILDLGTGSGAIALALANHFPDAYVTAVDNSNEALDLARDNTHNLKLDKQVQFLQSSWFTSLPHGRKYDLIISNPPYLSNQEVKETSLEVRGFEPISALVSQNDGIMDVEHIITTSYEWILEKGTLIIETGENHHDLIENIVSKDNRMKTESYKDLAGKNRYVFIERIL
jgi:release factor glutamine methyltransferase